MLGQIVGVVCLCFYVMCYSFFKNIQGDSFFNKGKIEVKIILRKVKIQSFLS